MRFGVGQKRTAIVVGNLSVALVAVTVGLAAITVAFFISHGSSPATPNVHSSSSSLGSSSSALSSSSAAQPGAQASSSQYPLVWGPNPPRACDVGEFCIDVTLGLLGQTATNNTTSSVTTIIGGNATTIINSTVTTIIRSNGTDVISLVNVTGTYVVTLSAFVQDAVTGLNATTPTPGIPVVESSCNLQPAGFTHCRIAAPYLPQVPPGDPYKVTVFVTKQYIPCSLRPAASLCSVPLLAPPSPTVTVSEGE